MRIEKHLIGQTFIVRYMEDTDSDILGLGFLITSSLMWISNRGYVFRDCGIILHPSGVFSNVLMQKKRRGIRKTSGLSKSDCSIHDITVVGICHVWNNHFLTNQMFSEYHVASFASTHSKTRHSDVI